MCPSSHMQNGYDYFFQGSHVEKSIKTLFCQKFFVKRRKFFSSAEFSIARAAIFPDTIAPLTPCKRNGSIIPLAVPAKMHFLKKWFGWVGYAPLE